MYTRNKRVPNTDLEEHQNGQYDTPDSLGPLSVCFERFNSAQTIQNLAAKINMSLYFMVYCDDFSATMPGKHSEFYIYFSITCTLLQTCQ